MLQTVEKNCQPTYWIPFLKEANLLTHCLLADSSAVTCWTSPFVFLGVSGVFCRFYSNFDGKILLANNVDPDQTLHNVVFDLGLH